MRPWNIKENLAPMVTFINQYNFDHTSHTGHHTVIFSHLNKKQHITDGKYPVAKTLYYNAEQ